MNHDPRHRPGWMDPHDAGFDSGHRSIYEMAEFDMPNVVSKMTPERVITGFPQFFSDAGSIANLLELTESENGIHGVSIIRSWTGSERSNHFHKTDSHWLYVISGEMIYQERPIGAGDYPPGLVVIAGQMVFTPPLVEHRTTFPCETVLLSLSRFARDAESHERDLVRVAP